MLHNPDRHEALQASPWDDTQVRQAIIDIVSRTEQAFSPDGDWAQHPLDADAGAGPQRTVPPLYHGTCGVFWALHYLQDVGAVTLQRSYYPHADALLRSNRAWLGAEADKEAASYLMGDTPILMWRLGHEPGAATTQRLLELIGGNIDHPARELMWGSPGTLLAALFLHERTGDGRFADLFRATAARLWSQLLWSEELQCHYWTQDLYGSQSNYIDAVHGFVATASPLIRGQALLDAADWTAWQRCIQNTVQRTAVWNGGHANWRAQLTSPAAKDMLMQYCHGAPGFIVCLADLPGTALDTLLVAAGEAVWAAGPLLKGSNLCHGTGGNGYAFLKLYERTGNALWLDRARAFAMHGIAQTRVHARRHGQLRHSLWTGDPGFAIYLWDCLRGEAAFPTLDVFYGSTAAAPAG